MNTMNTLSSDKSKTLILPCECIGPCSMLKVSYDKDPFYNELYLSHYVSSFNEKQNIFWWTIKRRFKLAWAMLTGKEFLLYELVIQPKDMKEFCDNVINMITIQEKLNVDKIIEEQVTKKQNPEANLFDE